MKKRLYRSKEQRMIGGVLGGIGRYFDVDPTIIRLAYIFIALFTWVVPSVVAYVIALIVIPEEPGGPVVHATGDNTRADSNTSNGEASSS